jgi:hypothetical protein
MCSTKNKLTTLNLTLLSFALFAPTLGNASNEVRFWQIVDPHSYANAQTDVLADQYPIFNYNECIEALDITPEFKLRTQLLDVAPEISLDHDKKKHEDRKRFVEEFDALAHNFIQWSNLVRQELDQEVKNINAGISNNPVEPTKRLSKKTRRILKAQYQKWLLETALAFYETRNHHLLSQVLAVLAKELNYKSSEKTFDRGELSEEDIRRFGILLNKFFTRQGSQNTENLLLQYNEIFYPNISHIRVELERLSSENYQISPKQATPLTNSICQRLSLFRPEGANPEKKSPNPSKMELLRRRLSFDRRFKAHVNSLQLN